MIHIHKILRPLFNGWRALPFLGILALLLLAVPPARADILPATITVNSTDDQQIDNGECTIAEAMQTAVATRQNDDCGPEVSSPVIITFTVSGTIKVNDQLPNIIDGANVSLVGPATIDLDSSGIGFDMDGGTMNMAAITIRNASTVSLNISSDATANLAGMVFDGNKATTSGAAIWNDGTLRIAGSNFIGNKVTSGNGGAIHSSGDLLIAGSLFNGNTSDSSGGAIDISGGKAEIDDTIFNGNVATGDSGNGGGAIYIHTNSTVKSLSITRSVFNGNLTTKGGGGAIFHNTTDIPLNIAKSSFQGNISGIPVAYPRPGGAILNWGTLAISHTMFLNNAAANNGGAIANGDADSGVQNSPPERNARLTVSNSTFTANAAADKGGAIANYYVVDGQAATITNATFSANAAQEGGAIYSGEPKYDLVSLANTIVDGSAGGNCADPDSATATVVSLGHNLESDNSCGFDKTGDINNKSANLDTPSFNGGPLAALLSQKLNSGSPAIDAGDPAICAAAPINNEDQRGEARPKDGDGNGSAICDIGAFENDTLKAGFGSTPVQPGPIDFGNVNFGAHQDVSITVLSTGNKALQLSSPQISGANAADFSLLTAFPLTVSSSSSVSLRCTPSGSTAGVRTATWTFATNDPDNSSVSFDLICNAVPQPQPGFGSNPAMPGPLDIGDVLLGKTASANISVKEIGTATLTVKSPVLGGANPGDFSVGAVNISLADGAAPTNISVSCTPTAPGIRSATLTLTTNDPTQTSAVFNISCTGKAPPPLALDTTSASSVDGGAIALNGPYGIAISPDGKNAYVVGWISDSLHVYSRDPETGALSANPIQEFTDATNLNGAIRVYVSADGKNVYVTTSVSNTALAYSRDPNTGLLTLVDSIKNGSSYGCFPMPCDGTIAGMASPYGMAFSPDGQYIYISAISTAGGDTSINVIRRNASNGGMTSLLSGANFVQRITHADLSIIYDLALSPDGTYLYAASYGNHTITIFKRDASTGKLTYVDTVDKVEVPGLKGVFRLAISPDGAHLYSASWDSNALTTFERNPATGKLTHVATYTDGGTDALGTTIDGLAEASAVALSPDGLIVYASGYSDAAVAAFERDPASGKLTFIQAVKRNGAGQPPLAGARDIGVGPEGHAIHVTGYDDDKVVTLRQPNPSPTLINLAPASATQSNSTATLTVNGQGFVPGAVVRWNNATNLATTFVSSSQLQATISAGLLSTASLRPVTVVNPTPGGGTSNALNFAITAPTDNPVPSISELSPAGALAGDAGMLVTVKGANFINGAQVRWNGSSRQTTFVSATTLQFQLDDADIAQPGDRAVTVVNPAPGGGTSNALAFSVAAPGQNPVPAIASLTPAFILAGAHSSLDLVILGSNFVQGAQAQWDGADRPTSFVSSGELHMTLSGADLVSAGSFSVQVINPAPGGGPSNVVSFRVGATGENPRPALSKVTSTVRNSNGTLTLTLSGSGFLSGSQARWNGASRTTTYVSATQIKITISQADFNGGTSVITIMNTSPGGGLSNELLYTIQQTYIPLIRR